MKNLNIIFLAVLLAFSISAHAEQVRFAELHNVQGNVAVQKVGSETWMDAFEGMVLQEMDVIKTPKGASVDVHLDKEAETGNFHMKEESMLRLAKLHRDDVSSDKTTLLDLALGSVIVRAEKLIGDSKFEVRTPTSTTGVRGTVFEVSVE